MTYLNSSFESLTFKELIAGVNVKDYLNIKTQNSDEISKAISMSAVLSAVTMPIGNINENNYVGFQRDVNSNIVQILYNQGEVKQPIALFVPPIKKIPPQLLIGTLLYTALHSNAGLF